MLILGRPMTVWAYTTLLFLSLIQDVLSLPLILSVNPLIGLAVLITALITAAFMFMFFTLKRKSLTWLYLLAAIGVIVRLIGATMVDIAIAFIIVILALVVRDYIIKKTINGKPLFN